MRDAPPLIFWFDFLVARFVQAITGASFESACMASSRIVDCMFHPWVAFPVVMLGYRWSDGKRDALLGCAAGALMAVMSPPVMRMAGDFQKNSLGMLWVALFIWAIYEALRLRKHVAPWFFVGVCFVLSALTHMGAFGVTCVLLVTTLFSFCVLTGTMRLTRTNAIVLAACAAFVSVMMVVMYSIQPGWTVRLLRLPLRAMTLLDFRVSPLALLWAVIVYSVMWIVLRRIWKARESLDPSTGSVVIGCMMTIIVLVIPIFDAVWLVRFQLMLPVPLAVLFAFWISRHAKNGTLTWQSKSLGIVAALLAVISPLFMQGPVITAAILSDLSQFEDEIEDPQRTMILAPHGVEYWVGYALGTHVKAGSVPRNTDPYEKIILLEPNEGFDRQRRPEPPRRPRDSRSRPPIRDTSSRLGHDHMLGVNIPPEAVLIRESEFFRVYELSLTH